MSDNPPQPDESISAKIRAEIRETILPNLQKAGKDPNSKDTYVPIVHDLEKRYKVDYVTAKKSWDKVLRDFGQKPPVIQSSTATAGGVTMKVSPQPKAQSKPEVVPQPTAPTAEPKAPPSPEEEKALAVKIFTAVHQTAGNALFSIAESVWKVKIERPNESKYQDAGKVWAEVAEAYDWKVPKLILLVGALALTGEIFATPLIVARAEAIKIAEEKETKEKGKP